MAPSEPEASGTPPPRRASTAAKLLMLLVSTLFSCAMLEGVVRIGGTTDADGQFRFIIPVRPFTIPAKATEEAIQAYERRDRPYQIFDLDLGWTVNTNAAHSNGLYRSNNLGIRSDRAMQIRHQGRKRVALFGDSFVHGDDVPLEESWAGILQTLRDDEILNFGVGGYGNDQAWLRYRHFGKQFRPDVVVIGFQPENCRRNLNLVRSIMLRRTGIPFSKPRFVREGGELRLVNSPAVPPEQLPAVLTHFEQWPLREYEGYYHPQDYRWTWLRASRALSLLDTAVTESIRSRKEDTAFFDGGEGPELCGAILSSFAAEAAKESRVAILHIPRRDDLARLMRGRDVHHQALLARLRAEHRVIDLAPALTEAARANGLAQLFVKRHYAEPANRIVAEIVAAFLDGKG